MPRLIEGSGEVIKCCAGPCGGAWADMREILRVFGRDKRRADGLQVYCRKCRRNARYKRLGKPQLLQN